MSIEKKNAKPNTAVRTREAYHVIQVAGESNVLQTNTWTSLAPQQPKKKFFKAWMLLILPILAASSYFYLAVPDRYVSSAKFIIKQGGSNTNSINALPLLSLGNDTSKQDALMLKDYLQSEKVFNLLDQKFYLKERFRDNNLDTTLHLNADASEETYLNYYNRLLTFEHNSLSNVITVKVQAFDPQTSQKILKELVRLSENFLNTVSSKIAENQLSFAKAEVNNSKSHLADIKTQLKSFQNTNKTISPFDETVAITGMIHQLEEELLHEEVNLNKYRAYLSEDSPKVQATTNAISTLKSKIAEQSALLAGPDSNGVKMNTINTEFEQLKFEEEFWQQSYLNSLKALEVSRMESIRQIKFILMVAEPTLAQMAEYPNRPYNILTLTLILFLIYGIGKLTVTTIRDHRDV